MRNRGTRGSRSRGRNQRVRLRRHVCIASTSLSWSSVDPNRDCPTGSFVFTSNSTSPISSTETAPVDFFRHFFDDGLLAIICKKPIGNLIIHPTKNSKF